MEEWGRTGFGDHMLAIYYLLTVTISLSIHLTSISLFSFKMASTAHRDIKQYATDTQGNQIPVNIPIKNKLTNIHRVLNVSPQN